MSLTNIAKYAYLSVLLKPLVFYEIIEKYYIESAEPLENGLLLTDNCFWHL